jgi:HEPN domain-containing protein
VYASSVNRGKDWFAQAVRDLEQARSSALDNAYVPARYPNGHPEGAPFEHYGPLQSTEAIAHADSILDFVRRQMA